MNFFQGRRMKKFKFSEKIPYNNVNNIIENYPEIYVYLFIYQFHSHFLPNYFAFGQFSTLRQHLKGCGKLDQVNSANLLFRL